MDSKEFFELYFDEVLFYGLDGTEYTVEAVYQQFADRFRRENEAQVWITDGLVRTHTHSHPLGEKDPQ